MGLHQDTTAAERYLQLAAANGHRRARYKLANRAYQQGQYLAALGQYEALQTEKPFLGYYLRVPTMYAEGLGVEANPRRFMELWKEALDTEIRFAEGHFGKILAGLQRRAAHGHADAEVYLSLAEELDLLRYTQALRDTHPFKTAPSSSISWRLL